MDHGTIFLCRDIYLDAELDDVAGRLAADGFRVRRGAPVTPGVKLVFTAETRAQSLADADVIVANRITDDIRDVADKVYSRDLFGKD